jgi:hypothetical protein
MGDLRRHYANIGRDFPTMDTILELSINQQTYLWFAQEFVRIVVGKKVWKSHAFRSDLSEFCSMSGEAFCLLTVENNYDRWSGMVESGDYADKNSTAPPPLYTNAGKSSRLKGTAKAFQGWTMEGYQRFNDLYDMVKYDRVSPGRKFYETTLRSLVADENTKQRPSRVVEEDDGEVIYPAHDLEGVAMGGLNLLARSAHDAGEEEDEDDQSPSEDEEDNQDEEIEFEEHEDEFE